MNQAKNAYHHVLPDNDIVDKNEKIIGTVHFYNATIIWHT